MRWDLIRSAWLVCTVGLLLFACGDSDEGDACIVGAEDCACGPALSCFGDLSCVDEVCQPPTCMLGEVDCACDADGSCAADSFGRVPSCIEGVCALAECAAGDPTCPCLEDGSCNDGYVCDGSAGFDRCVVPDCDDGGLDCACQVDGTCEAGLECASGICVESSCPAGEEGCDCSESGSCDGDLVCVEGICSARDCDAGTVGCPCADGACEDGALCDGDNICVVAADPGFEGGPCVEGRCAYGYRCSADNLCVTCTPGTTDCGCEPGDICSIAGLMCVGGLCVPESEARAPAPEDPVCYTPCRQSLVTDEGFRIECDPTTGLMEGCWGGSSAGDVGEAYSLSCVEGSCTDTGVAPTCSTDLDCPAWQQCYPEEGLCKSNCESTEDCPTGLDCHRYVCRHSCSSEAPCPSAMYCDKPDGEFGYCMPVAPTDPPEESPAAELDQAFTLSTSSLSFTNTSPTTSFVIFNHSDENQRFVVRKYSHVVNYETGEPQRFLDLDDGVACDTPPCSSDEDCGAQSCHRGLCSENCTRAEPGCGDGYFCELLDGDDGRCVPHVLPSGCPLSWLEVGAPGDRSLGQEYEVIVAAQGAATVELDASTPEDGSGSAPLSRWSGVLEVVSPSLGRSTVSIDYSVTAEGRWQGQAIYFNDFNDSGLDEWMALSDADRNTERAIAEAVQNEMMKRWFSTRRGELPWTEFLEVLNSTSTETWRNPDVAADCFAEGFDSCYPCSSNITGLCGYGDPSDIPTGIFVLPFGLNMAPERGSETEFVGRIETSAALHYAGNPALTISFVDSPADGTNSFFGTTMTRLQEFSADIAVGGRHETSGDCADSGLTSVEIPWLVPGFERNVAVDPETGMLLRVECRDDALPYGASAPAENASLAMSNPVPDGRSRRRTIELVDGALVDERVLFVLFREQVESFLGESDEDGFFTYGALVLQREDVGLEEADYVGWNPEPVDTEPEGLLAPTCSEDLLRAMVGEPTLTDENVEDALWILLSGVANAAVDESILWPVGSDRCGETGCWEQPHYLCHATGLFDGGPGNTTGTGDDDDVPHDNTCGRTDLDVTGPYNGYAGNCSCDDGGPGSDTSICPLGTDRNDCSAEPVPCYAEGAEGFSGTLAQQLCECDEAAYEPPVSGPRSAADFDTFVECPIGSEVTYFTVDRDALSQSEIAALPCQTADPPNCGETLERWLDGADSPLIQLDPFWRCAEVELGGEVVTPVYCDAERHDLRSGKEFYSVFADETPMFQPLEPAIEYAFRYRTQFTDRDGAGIGFAPELCEEGTDGLTPYCFDPLGVEQARQRVDCLLVIWDQFVARSDGAPRRISRASEDALVDFLRVNTSAEAPPTVDGLPDPYATDGFERLYAELLIMLADDARATAAGSRFDLAASRSVSFPGDVFEPDGVSLSGSLGFEMYSLYQATQYYQEAIDRFYRLSPFVWESVSPNFEGEVSIVRTRTATRYIDRVVHASSQRARAWSDIAERYASLNRPDLAARVIDRAYTSAYLESGILARLMLRIETSASVAERDEIRALFDEAQSRYRAGLSDMRRVRADVVQTENIYGLPPDFIPFPALDDYRALNAFEIIFQRAEQKARVAREREDLAVSSDREFDTNAEEFQSELVRIRNTYEGQLLEMCGSFEGGDGRIYPAIVRYAGLSERTRQLGDPCGYVGNGKIHEALVNIEDTGLAAQAVARRFDEILEEVAIEQSRIEAQCRLIYATADYVYRQGQRELTLRDAINDANVAIDGLSRAGNLALGVAGIVAGGGLFGAAGTFGLTASLVALDAGAVTLGARVGNLEEQIQEIEFQTARWNTQGDCDTIEIDGDARMATLLVGLKELEIEAARAELAIELAFAEVIELQNRAQRTEEEQSEAEQLLINVTAARNDPNVRIYRNDAVLNAEFSFEDAMREAYAATRAFEYYTSQTYADRESFYLIRMIGRGEYNLENYLAGLQNAFFEFEDAFRAPDTRVMVLSLRDDVLRIPELDERGLALSESERDRMFTDAVTDLSRLDRNGYLSFPFRTSLDEVSPLTNNHKVVRIEVDLVGTRLGDHVGRAYVRQVGTGWVRGTDGSNTAYRFPEQLAVVNTSFQGARFFDDAEVYRNFRLRDRPLANTGWELVLNLRDEAVNQDIDVTGLDDVRMVIYYSDFTNLP